MPAGNLHAYLSGRRGGDHGQLRQRDARRSDTQAHRRRRAAVACWTSPPASPGLVSRSRSPPGLWRYPTPAPEFALWRLAVDGSPVAAPASGAARILLVTEGAVTARSARLRGQPRTRSVRPAGGRRRGHRGRHRQRVPRRAGRFRHRTRRRRLTEVLLPRLPGSNPSNDSDRRLVEGWRTSAPYWVISPASWIPSPERLVRWVRRRPRIPRKAEVFSAPRCGNVPPR